MSTENRVDIYLVATRNEKLLKYYFESFEFISFDSYAMKNITNMRTRKFNRDKFSNLFLDELSNKHFTIDCDSANEHLHMFNHVENSNFVSINITLLLETYNKFKHEIDEWANNAMLDFGVVAYMGNSSDIFWQNNWQMHIYEVYGKSIDGLPLTIEPNLNVEAVDVSKLPGSDTIVKGIWFGAAWKMWFNSPYYKFVSKEAITNFKDCYLNKNLSDGCIHIQLYENIDDFEKTSNRNRQWAFKKAINYDEVIKNAIKAFVDYENDPVIEIMEGTFEHGGIKLIYYYLNEEGKQINKNNASQVEVVEYTSTGEIIFQEIKQLH